MILNLNHDHVDPSQETEAHASGRFPQTLVESIRAVKHAVSECPDQDKLPKDIVEVIRDLREMVIEGLDQNKPPHRKHSKHAVSLLTVTCWKCEQRFIVNVANRKEWVRHFRADIEHCPCCRGVMPHNPNVHYHENIAGCIASFIPQS